MTRLANLTIFWIESEVSLIKPQELFLGSFVYPAAEVLFRFTRLPVKTFGFIPSVICPAHIVDFGGLRL